MRRQSNSAYPSPILTVAVPAYNVEAYLDSCLNSLIGTDDLLEVLIIDDGSSDRTAAIARKFSRKYRHISLISKENGGHGSTINTALACARGKYFKLLDGDDYVDQESLAILVDFLKTAGADIILTDYVEYYMESGKHVPIKNYSGLTPKKQYTLRNNQDIFTSKGPLLSTTTFKTALFKENPFHIDEHCFYVDMEYNFFIYQRAKTLTYLPTDLYFYRLERQGQSMQRSSLEKKYKHHEKVSLRLAEELSSPRTMESPQYDYLLRYIVAPFCRSHYQLLIEYLQDRELFLAFDKKLESYPPIYHSHLVSGKIIGIHRLTGGLTIASDGLLRKFGRVLKRFETE